MSQSPYVRKSLIHGRGLFAGRSIGRGRYIGSYAGRRTSRNGRYVLWVPGNNGDYEGIAGKNDLRFVNHSRRPNAAFYGAELFSLRQIHPHEEITVNYGSDWRDED